MLAGTAAFDLVLGAPPFMPLGSGVQQPGTAAAALPRSYRPRQPHTTVLHHPRAPTADGKYMFLQAL